MSLPVPGYNPHTPNIDLALATGNPELAARLANQNRRIHQGLESGTLNQPELLALKEQRRELGSTLRNDMLNGTPFTGPINQQLNASSIDIFQYKHNA